MRRPARLERAGALTPRDRIWDAMRSFGPSASFSVAEIMALAEQRADTVISYIDGLCKAGFVEFINEPPRPVRRARRECRRYYLVRDIGVEAPRVDANGKPVTQGIGRDQMWRAMRVLKSFDCRALAAAASTKQHPVAVEEAKTYVKFLARAGYLQLQRKGSGSVPSTYRFVRARDTGPRAPLVTRDKGVMDANTGAIVYEPKAQLQEGTYVK